MRFHGANGGLRDGADVAHAGAGLKPVDTGNHCAAPGNGYFAGVLEKSTVGTSFFASGIS
jgi:hypothetical protein